MSDINNQFKGSIKLSGGLIPNNLGFPIVRARDVLVNEDGTRLSDIIDNMSNSGSVPESSNIGLATSLSNGLMSKEDKQKLDLIDDEANHYTLADDGLFEDIIELNEDYLSEAGDTYTHRLITKEEGDILNNLGNSGSTGDTNNSCWRKTYDPSLPLLAIMFDGDSASYVYGDEENHYSVCSAKQVIYFRNTTEIEGLYYVTGNTHFFIDDYDRLQLDSLSVGPDGRVEAYFDYYGQSCMLYIQPLAFLQCNI